MKKLVSKKKAGMLAFMFLIVVIIPVYQFNLLGRKFATPSAGVLDIWATWGDAPDQLQGIFDAYEEPVKVATGVRSSDLLGALASESPPDLVILSSNQMVKALYDEGRLETLDPWTESTGIHLEDFFSAPLEQCQMPDSSHACLPWGADVFALYWNKDLFAAAGLDPEQPPRTMEELAEFARKLTVVDDSGQISQVGFMPDYTRSHTDLYANMLGGFWATGDGTQLTVTSQPVIDAFTWQMQFYDRFEARDLNKFTLSVNKYMNSSHPEFASARLNCQQCHRQSPRNSAKIPDHGFYNGQVAMMVDAQWQVGSAYIPTLKPDLNYGVAPFPPPADRPERANTTVVQGPVVIIPSGANDKDAAIKFLAWMMSPEIVAEITLSNALLPTSRTAAQAASFQQVPHFELFMGLLDNPNAYSIPASSNSEEINQSLRSAEKELLHERAGDPATLLKSIQVEFASENE